MAGACAISGFSALPCAADTADQALWDSFLQYDLCIGDFGALSAEEQSLCRFIFDTEQAANDNIVCERARRILAGEDVGDRLTLSQLAEAYGVWDNNSYYKPYTGWQAYIDCVPDVIRFDCDPETLSDPLYCNYDMEYWLDDARNQYVLFREKNAPENFSRFEVYDKDNRLIETVPTVLDCPMKDFRGDAAYMADFGFIEQDGGYYYLKPDGTAVFAWSAYSRADSDSPVTEPFVIAREIGGAPVTAIEHGALENAPFTEIVLPDTLHIIDRNAFSGCKYLERVNFPETLEYIGIYAFTGCDALTDIVLDCPDLRLTRMAFADCTALESVRLRVKEIGEYSFAGCEKLKRAVLENGIERIGYGAFSGDRALAGITLPGSVKYIEQGAFQRTAHSVKMPSDEMLIGAFPHKTPQTLTSGIEPPAPRRPLTDAPVCAFDADCTVYGFADTAAAGYAAEWALNFLPAGDLNGDGALSVADAVLLIRYLTNAADTKLPGWTAADMNGDYTLDAKDLTLLKRSLLGK